MKKQYFIATVSDRPVISLLLGDLALGRHYQQAAADNGWDPVIPDRTATDRRLDPAIRLVITDMAGVAAIAAARGPATAATGLVAIGAAGVVADADGTLDPQATAGDLAAYFAAWRPLPPPQATLRQIDTFGPAAMQPLLLSLRVRLASALAEGLPSGDAHQIAGLAGMLGFSPVAVALEALSRGGDSERGDARRLARLTIGALDAIGFSGVDD